MKIWNSVKTWGYIKAIILTEYQEKKTVTVTKITEVIFCKRISPKQNVHVILWITNENLIREISFDVTDMLLFRKWIPKTNIYVYDLFWLECKP